jgi:hypothetical protein
MPIDSDFRQARNPGLTQDFDAVFSEGCARRDDTFCGDVGALDASL